MVSLPSIQAPLGWCRPYHPYHPYHPCQNSYFIYYWGVLYLKRGQNPVVDFAELSEWAVGIVNVRCYHWLHLSWRNHCHPLYKTLRLKWYNITISYNWGFPKLQLLLSGNCKSSIKSCPSLFCMYGDKFYHNRRFYSETILIVLKT